MADDLEARLESHAQAFEGLLSLIPANQYYSKDNSDQWQRKKQTKEQKRQAKRAKLDPQNQKSAKDVMDDNERKRKRELGIESDQDDSVSNIYLPVEPEQPAQSLRKTKKQKVDPPAQNGEEEVDGDPAEKADKVDKRKEKRRLKKEKAEKQKQKLEAKKARKNQDNDGGADSDKDSENEEDDQWVDESVQIDPMDISGLADGDNEAPADSTASSPDQTSAVSDNSANQSATSSASSIAPNPNSTTNGDASTAKPKKIKLPEVNPEELQARLKARIEQLRAQRKADSANGQPARSRQELLESRRKKSEARKAHKKELRIKAKEEEERLNNERLRGSGSPLSTDIFSPRPIDENNFSFGRVAFEGGVEADPTLNSITEHKKRKGPQDTRTALIAAEKKAARLAGYDESKRAEIEEKDMWLNAKKRAHGERVRDDQNLLKKALKRKEKAKTKSATEWNERIDNVKKGKEAKQRKRDDNLAKRRDEKMAHRSGKKGGGSKTKKKGRPGFEGRFKQ